MTAYLPLYSSYIKFVIGLSRSSHTSDLQSLPYSYPTHPRYNYVLTAVIGFAQISGSSSRPVRRAAGAPFATPDIHVVVS